MIDEDILAIGGFFFTSIVLGLGLGLGVPLVKSWIRRREMSPILTPADMEREKRLERLETAIESIAVEVERISEGQRFVTRLLAEREGVREPVRQLPASEERRG
jgi:hypothetical protein